MCHNRPVTIIAAVEHEGTVYIAGDSGQSSEGDGTIFQVADPKVWKSGEFVYGCADEARYAQIVRHGFRPSPLPRIKTDEAMDAYFTNEFVTELRKIFTSDMELKGEDKYPDLEMIVGVRGRIYEVYGTFSWCRPLDGFAAVGSGHLAARVALACLPKLSPKARLTKALDMACRFTIHCRPPYVYESV